MTWHVVHDADGHAVSIGTVLADPLAGGFTAVALSDSDAARLRDGSGRWDAATLAVVDAPGAPDPKEALLAALDADVLLVDDLRDIVRQVIEQGVV